MRMRLPGAVVPGSNVTSPEGEGDGPADSLAEGVAIGLAGSRSVEEGIVGELAVGEAPADRSDEGAPVGPQAASRMSVASTVSVRTVAQR